MYLEQLDGPAHRKRAPRFAVEAAQISILREWKALLQKVNGRFRVSHRDAGRVCLRSQHPGTTIEKKHGKISCEAPALDEETRGH